jgi:hypothetical protein
MMRVKSLAAAVILVLTSHRAGAQVLVGPDVPVPELRFIRQNVRSDAKTDLRCATGTIHFVRPWVRAPFNDIDLGYFVEIQSLTQAAPPRAGRYLGALSTKTPLRLLISDQIDEENAIMSMSADEPAKAIENSPLLYAALVRSRLAASVPDAQIAVGKSLESGCNVSGTLDLAEETRGQTTKGPVTGLTFRFEGIVTAAQYRREPPISDAKSVVANLHDKEGRSIGAGIILGVQGDYLYIATCHHVVWSAAGPASGLSVSFFSRQDARFPAVVMNGADTQLDLGLVGVPISAAAGMPEVKQLVIGAVDQLPQGVRVRSVGHPSGVPWRTAVSEERFARRLPNDLEFESPIGDEGSSGGAVFNACGGLIGMTKRAGGGVAVATRIDRILRKLDEWNVGVKRSTASCAAQD